MDGLPAYQQSSNNRWMKLLFLSTGFVIGGMCLWAFVEKRTGRQGRMPSLTQGTATANTTPPPQVAIPANVDLLPTESPASDAIQASHLETAAIETDHAVYQAFHSPSAPYPMVAAEPPAAAPEQFVSLPEQHSEATSVPESYSPLPAEHVSPIPYDFAPPSHVATPSVSLVHPNSVETKLNDSFWKIAERVYGDPRYYRALFEHNRNWIAYPDQIEHGFQVMTPTAEELRRLYPTLCPEVAR